jgi:hypothetical protein
MSPADGLTKPLERLKHTSSKQLFGIIDCNSIMLEYKPLNAARECGVTFFSNTSSTTVDWLV